MVVVICHFKENLDWVKNLKHKYVIYNKNSEEQHLYDINLPNVGFDTIVYLKYIIDNYDNLPDFVCFSQNDPFFHCENFLNKVNEFDFTKKFQPLGKTYIRDTKELDHAIEYANNNEIAYELPIKFINSAQCIVSKELILKRTKNSYQKIKDSIPLEIISNINYLIEYLWPTILGFNDELILSLNNC
jgi:hypothetical protein